MTDQQLIHKQSIYAAISAVVVVVVGFFLTSGAYSLVERVRIVEVNQASIKQDLDWIRRNMEVLYTKGDAAIDDINDKQQWDAIQELDRRVDTIEMKRSAQQSQEQAKAQGLEP